MTTYKIPKAGREYIPYTEYCTSLPFVFNGPANLSIDYASEEVTVDGSIEGFEVVTYPAGFVSVVISKLQFLDRFTPAELAGILEAAKTNSTVSVIMKRFDAASDITVNDVRTSEGVGALVAYGLVTSARATEILTV